MVHIFYHNDCDGFASAAIIGATYLESVGDKEVRWKQPVAFHICDHSHPIDFTVINDNEPNTLYFVDYSFSRQDDQELLETYLLNHGTTRFIWIDHHKTSKVIIKNHPIFEEFLKADGYVLTPEEDGHIKEDPNDDNYSGAMLCYFYVINQYWYKRHYGDAEWDGTLRGTKDFKEKNLKALKNLYEKAPEWIRLVSDHDVWRHEIPGSDEFTKGCSQKGMYSTFLGLKEPNKVSYMVMFFKNIIEPMVNGTGRNDMYEMVQKNQTVQMIETGRNLFEWEDSKNCRLLKSNAYEAGVHIRVPRDYIDPENVMKFPTDQNGVIDAEARILCINNYGNSRVFLNNIEKYDAVVIFTYDGESFKHSMFSKADGGFRCNLAALYFGKFFGITGGGHDHAAGWQSMEPTFHKNKVLHGTESQTWETDITEPHWENGYREETMVGTI